MKKMILAALLLATAFTLGTGTLPAEAAKKGKAGCDTPCDCRGPEGGPGGGHFFGKMAKDLGLTASQKEQIKKIIADEKEKNAPLRDKLLDGRKKMHEATKAETFDEAAVRAIATGMSESRIEMMVSHARAKNRINSILTPEQRAKAEKLAPKHGHRGGMMMPPPEEE